MNQESDPLTRDRFITIGTKHVPSAKMLIMGPTSGTDGGFTEWLTVGRFPHGILPSYPWGTVWFLGHLDSWRQRGGSLIA